MEQRPNGVVGIDAADPLDGDVAARLAEEGGEPMTEPLFDAATSDGASPDTAPRPPVSPAHESFEIEASDAFESPEPGPPDARSSA